MYLPPQFNYSKDIQLALELMQAHPFASLISDQANAVPFVTHLPLHAQQEGDNVVLLGHVAKANPHSKLLLAAHMADACTVATFMGPHAYMSPSVYPDLERVPTWNYLAVHCTVQVQILDVVKDKDALLKALIQDHEPGYAQQWRDLSEEFQHKLMAGITAFKLHVTQLECKVKLNQHRKEAHASMHQQYLNSPDPQAQALAKWCERLGLV